MMKEVSVQELKSMIDSKEDFQLIDVREQNEYDFCHINGELVPLKKIESYADKIRKDVCNRFESYIQLNYIYLFFIYILFL